MKTRVRLAALLSVVLVVGGLAACTSDEGTSGADATTTDASTAPSDPSSTPVADNADFTRVDDAVVDFVAEHQLNGAGLVVVERDEGIVHEFYVGEFDADRRSLIASASKMLTAGVLLRLDDQDLIDLDAPIVEAVDWVGGDPTMTPAQLISNNSGLVGLLPDPTFAPYICQYLSTGTLQECAEHIFTTSEDDADVAEPGTEFRYGGGQWQVAGGVAEVVSGKSWAELVDETYVEPCGVDSLAYNNHYAQITSDEGPFYYPHQFDDDPSVLEQTQNPSMEGGAYIAPVDYAELVLMLLRGGTCGDERVLSAEAIESMTTSRFGEDFEMGLGNETAFAGYSMGWWNLAGDGNIVEDAGAFGAVPWMDLDRGYGAYLVVEATTEQGAQLARLIRPMIEEQVDTARG